MAKRRKAELADRLVRECLERKLYGNKRLKLSKNGRAMLYTHEPHLHTNCTPSAAGVVWCVENSLIVDGTLTELGLEVLATAQVTAALCKND